MTTASAGLSSIEASLRSTGAIMGGGDSASDKILRVLGGFRRIARGFSFSHHGCALQVHQ